MKKGIESQPVSAVQWVDRSLLKPNHYNPNHVAPPELELLITSITEDGWTQPIVVLPDYTIVDGFHRYTVSADPRLQEMTGGLVPVVMTELDPTHRMMSTIRHNRARGEHGVLPMANIVRTMHEDGVPQDEIQKRLGMEDEEVERLLDRSGMTIRGSADGFGKAWVPAQK
jgi:ParB-like chromosome segregation protein Spo0J